MQKKGGIWETIRFIAISLIIVFCVRYFIAQPFVVSGESMVPTFENGEYLVVDEISYRFKEPARDDVIILRYPPDPKKFFIKRIIGLPGEKLVFEGSTLTITPASNGTPIVLNEPFIKFPKENYLAVTLKPDEYFVMGDNRAESSDSRMWGPLPRKNIVGTALVRLLPLNRIDWKPGAVTTEIQN